MGMKEEMFVKVYVSRLFKIAYGVLREERLAELVVEEVFCSFFKDKDVWEACDIERTLSVRTTRKAIEMKQHILSNTVPIDTRLIPKERKYSGAKWLKVIYK